MVEGHTSSKELKPFSVSLACGIGNIVLSSRRVVVVLIRLLFFNWRFREDEGEVCDACSEHGHSC